MALFSWTAAFAGIQFVAGPNETTVSGQLLVRFAQGASAASVLQQVAPGATSTPVNAGANIHLVQLPLAAPLGVPAALAARSDVLYVEPNRVRKAQALIPNDPQVNAQWALQNVQAEQAWGAAPDGFLTSAVAEYGRIRVAVLDTGVDCTHPDFINAGGGSTDSAAGGQINWSLSQTFYPTTAPTPCNWGDDFGHGTHVAGIIAASANNGQGIAGLAYPVEILVYKVLDSNGSGDDGKISQAIIDAANSGASVISLSLGSPGYSQTLQNAVNYAWQKNAIVVAAGGNDAKNELFFPAGANYALGVAATDGNDNLASFSDSGPGIAVGAPGVGILSTVPTYPNQEGVTGYDSISGTSMATPHVSAVGGMIFATSPNMSAAMARMIVEQSADNGNFGGQAGQQLGYGRVNLYRAVSGNLRPSSLGGIAGQVVDINGNPVGTNPTVTVAGQSQTVVNATGLFRFYGIAPGSYTAVVSAPGYPTGTFQIGVAAGADTNFTPVLGGTPAQFSGVVTDNGQGVGGAVVEAISNGLIVSTAVTAPGGGYSLYVQPGTYTVQAAALYRVTNSVTQGVGPYGNTTVNLNLPAMGTVSGHIALPGGAPAVNATVNINGPRNTTATTDGNGHYSSIGLVPGGYTVTASTGGQSNVSGSAGVSVDAASVVNLQFGGGFVAPAPPAAPPAPPPPPVAPPVAPAPPASPAPPANPPGGNFTTIRVHAGGGGLTDAFGNVWSGDTGFSGGYTYADSNPIPNSWTPALYQSQRWNSAAPVQYHFAAPNGSYSVNLKFAETWFSSAGQRVFNIVINGQQVATNFDIAKAAGGPNLAIDLSYPVNVSNGQIVIQLNPVVSNPEINAIEIDAGGTPAPSAIRVRAGGSQYVDSLGQTWAADTGFTDGLPWAYWGGIGNTSDQSLYQTERFTLFQPLQYQFAAPNGTNAVTLKFSENWFNASGQRLFNIVINGQTVQSGFDIVAAAGGPHTAVDRTYLVNVTNGQLVIQLVPVVSNPKIDAIQIIQR